MRNWCSKCNGSGWVRLVLWPFRKCPRCKGTMSEPPPQWVKDIIEDRDHRPRTSAPATPPKDYVPSPAAPPPVRRLTADDFWIDDHQECEDFGIRFIANPKLSDKPMLEGKMGQKNAPWPPSV